MDIAMTPRPAPVPVGEPVSVVDALGSARPSR
jgi:hypothetical protein